jgi:GAF domain-containing protein
MTRIDELGSLTDVTAALVGETDVHGLAARILEDTCRAVRSDAVGALVSKPSGDLELLAATSHAVVDLELYQAATGEGPCVDCVREGAAIVSATPADTAARWPGVATRMQQAGYQSLRSVPLRWRGEVVGGLNVFWARTHAGDGEDVGLRVQALADMLAIALVSIRPMTAEEVQGRIREALRGRGVVEQAKGVLAHRLGLDMADAFQALKKLAAERGLPLGEAARLVVEEAWRPG